MATEYVAAPIVGPSTPQTAEQWAARAMQILASQPPKPEPRDLSAADEARWLDLHTGQDEDAWLWRAMERRWR